MTALVTVAQLIAYLSDNEVWRPIAGYPGYEVSSFGQVRRNGKAPLLASLTQGYLHVSLSRCNEVRTHRLHRLVADAFLGDAPFAGAQVAHNDGDSEHCNVGNLRWASALENQADRDRHNTRVRGSAVFGSKLVEDSVVAIRSRLASGERYQSIARDFGVSVSTICLIKKNRIWSHV